jgi:general stress protein 26
VIKPPLNRNLTSLASDKRAALTSWRAGQEFRAKVLEMSKEMTREDKLKKLREIVKAVDICMLTTVDEQGDLHSRPMSNNGEVEFDGDLWFFTYGSSHKVDEIGHVPKVNASFADTDAQLYASVSGHAEIVRDRGKIKELWQPQLRAWFPEGVDTPDIALLKVTAERAEYWDGSQSVMAHAVSFVGSLVTGKPAQFGENEKLNLVK